MKSLFAAALCLLITSSGLAQTVSADSAKYHIDSIVTVCGKVSHVYSTYSKDISLLFGKGPDFSLRIKVYGKDSVNLQRAETYLNKNVCVTGLIKQEIDRPEIIIKSASQIRLAE